MSTKKIKIGLATLFMAAISTVSAQQVTGDVGKTEDLGRSSALNGTIRVIDNKGTKKFLQVQNGITLLTDTTPDGGIISTWQLGGDLSNDTYIDVKGNAFSLDGLELVPSTSEAAATATTLSIGSNATTITGAGTASTDTGWTVLIRDEATGKVQKLLASDLVKGGRIEFEAAADPANAGLGVVQVTDLSFLTLSTDVNKVSVYRNGAKLRASVDYTIDTSGAMPGVNLIPNATAPNDWEIYEGDIFEVQWIN